MRSRFLEREGLICRSSSVLWTVEWIVGIGEEANTILEHKY
jgi:hypothetical protein